MLDDIGYAESRADNDKEKVLITDPNAAASTGMASSSFTWHQAAEIGMNTKQFITYLIELVHKRRKVKSSK